MNLTKTSGLIVATFLGLSASMFGFRAAVSSFDGVIYISQDSLSPMKRNPAAIRRDLDFSRLDGAELITASQKRLVTAARIVLEDQDMGVELGNFVTRGDDGSRQLACDFYDRIELSFEAEGLAESGDKPTMKVSGPCLTSRDITRVEPVWIPVVKILNERPSNMDVTFSDDDKEVNLSFAHMGAQWPQRWSLHSVRLFNDAEPGREVSISERELHDILQKPLVINWQAVQ